MAVLQNVTAVTLFQSRRERLAMQVCQIVTTLMSWLRFCKDRSMHSRGNKRCSPNKDVSPERRVSIPYSGTPVLCRWCRPRSAYQWSSWAHYRSGTLTGVTDKSLCRYYIRAATFWWCSFSAVCASSSRSCIALASRKIVDQCTCLPEIVGLIQRRYSETFFVA